MSLIPFVRRLILPPVLALAWLPLLACSAPALCSMRPVALPAQDKQLHGPYALVRVIDGDTLWIAHEGKLEKLRLRGVDTEEREWAKKEGEERLNRKPPTEFGTETAHWAEEYFKRLGSPGKPVQLRLDVRVGGVGRDAFGRLLCHVYLPDDVHFNLLLVQLGKSPYYNKYGEARVDRFAFEQAERAARKGKLGIWSDANRARSDAPPYDRLAAWWKARSMALEDFDNRLVQGQAILDAEDGPAMREAWKRGGEGTGTRFTVFGSVERFFEEPDGSLTALLNTGANGEPLRLVLPRDLRHSEVEKTLRNSARKFRQNYLYLSGRLSLGERGISMLADANSHWRLAGPEPALFAARRTKH